MEWEIGEIRKVDGNWYQCINSITCNGCGFNDKGCTADRRLTGDCSGRLDGASVIFKKLEKVGEPYRRWLSPFNNIMVQRYRLYGRNVIMPDEPIMLLEPNYKNSVEIEIKQNKEDMKETR